MPHALSSPGTRCPVRMLGAWDQRAVELQKEIQPSNQKSLVEFYSSNFLVFLEYLWYLFGGFGIWEPVAFQGCLLLFGMPWSAAVWLIALGIPAGIVWWVGFFTWPRSVGLTEVEVWKHVKTHCDCWKILNLWRDALDPVGSWPEFQSILAS